ncbi:hypothetical protein [Aliivibrio sifiae]|uniref:Uncharacterized protein n=1 Tax=Aliivibrio sifiae TaxID=566293 RepID=A0A2S7X883_9GAMM|nr:hypothetical protein [Aliivibrio sifiae]PQJ87573.1 hypothetical protein BTO23_15830 [Aliivibrio sifiae]GLR73177.1 hypothetical protein GCM10007855_00500 [Aliivibrio sifiae]
MNEYYFPKENTYTPMYEVPEEYEEGAYSTRFTFPSKPIPVLSKYKLKESYQISDIILHPEFSISLNIYNSINIKNIYGGNWIPILLKDKGEHEFMMLQLANELNVIDHEKSEFKRKKRGSISGMKKLILDPDKIESIPLYKRLIFKDESWGFHTFYHKKIVEKIMSMNPTGIEFIPVNNFNDSWVG